MKEDCFLTGIFHNLCCYLIRCKVTDSLFPDFIRLSHRNPYICIDHICILCSYLHIFCQSNTSAGSLGIFFTQRYQLCIWKISLCSAGYKMHAQFCAGDHQGISHIVSGISHIYQLTSLQISKMLTDRKHICQHLCRMIFICQAIPYRNSGIFCKFLYNILSITAIFNTIIHSSQNSGCICNALFLSYLRS